MALIISQNNIRFALDKISYETYGVLFTKSGSEIDFSEVSSIASINLNYSQPGNSEIYIAFKLDGVWCALNSSGGVNSMNSANSIFEALDTIGADNPDFDTLRNFGNTPAELLHANLNIFVGKKIGLAIALYTPDKINAMPKIKISFNVSYSSQKLSYSEYSPVFEFDEPVIINNIAFEKNEYLGGSSTLYARADKSDGSTINYSEPNNLRGEKVTALQFRADYLVTEQAGSHAGMNYVNTIYSSSSSITSGVTQGEIISLTQNWYMNISQVRMTIKHAPLKNSIIEAYCAFRDEPKKITGEILGNGTGGKITLQLANKIGLNYDSVKLFFDGQRVYSDFEINTEAGRITCIAPEGALISCDYSYAWDKEIWQKMNLSQRYELDDYELSEFRLVTDQEHKTICAVKILVDMTYGEILNENIGVGAGITKAYKLAHNVRDGQIKIFANGTAISSKNYYLGEDTQYVYVSANSGARLTAYYEWISETPKIYQFCAVFGE